MDVEGNFRLLFRYQYFVLGQFCLSKMLIYLRVQVQQEFLDFWVWDYVK